MICPICDTVLGPQQKQTPSLFTIQAGSQPTPFGTCWKLYNFGSPNTSRPNSVPIFTDDTCPLFVLV